MEFIYNNLPKPKVPDDIMHPKSRVLFRFWEEMRGEMAAAKKQDLKLKNIAKILPNVCILERQLDSPTYIWRLVGTGICSLWGHELTGKDVLEGWPEFERQSMTTGFEMVLATFQPFVARFKAISESGGEIGVELLVLPIQDSKTGAIQLLGTAVPFRSNYQSEDHRLISFELSTMRKIWTEPLPGDDLANARYGFLKEPNKALPFLKIIEGGKDH